MSVARFDCSDGGAAFCQGCYTMARDDEYGEYVRYEDYVLLQQELARYESARVTLLQMIVDRNKQIENQRELIEGREKQLSERLRQIEELKESLHRSGYAGYDANGTPVA